MQAGVRLWAGVLGAAACAALVLALPAGAGLGGFVAPLTGATVVVGGIPSCPVSPGFPGERVGPTGLLEDGKYLFFSDTCNGTLYRVSSAGGTVASARRAKVGFVVALVKAGPHYYLARFGTDANAGLWEFDPTTLAPEGTAPVVAVPDVRGAAVDPKTHDVFLSSDSKIVRVHGLTGAKPVVKDFGPAAAGLYDGLAFDPSGSTLYATDRYDYPSIHVVGLDRAGAKVSDVVDPRQGEGLAVTRSGLVLVNENGTNGTSAATYGAVSTLAKGATTPTVVATGGTRGGFAIVDCKGFMVIDQSSSIVRLTPALFPPNAGTGACSSAVKP